MKKFCATLLFTLLAPFVLCACNEENASQETGDDNTLVVLNYGKHLDSSVIKMFEEETGIKIKLEEYESILHLREKNVKIKDKIKNISSDLRNEIEDILDN